MNAIKRTIARFGAGAAALSAAAVVTGAVTMIGQPAHAIEAPRVDLSVKVTSPSPIRGQVGETVTVEFVVHNPGRTRVPAAAVTIDIVAPNGNEVVPIPDARCKAKGRQARCASPSNYEPGDTALSFGVRVKRPAGSANGSVRINHDDQNPRNNIAQYVLSVGSPGASRTATPRASAKPTASETETVLDPGTTDVQPAVQDEQAPPTAAGDDDGLSAGMWIGGGAIMAALALLGALLYLRRQDAEEAQPGSGRFAQGLGGPAYPPPAYPPLAGPGAGFPSDETREFPFHPR